MSSNNYWAQREAEALKHRLTDEKEYEKQIKQIYSDMLDNCQKEINSFYGKYAAKEGITLAEAKKRVSQLDIAAYERKAKRYVKDKDFSPQANEEMRLYNLTMKVNRLEMLKANLGLELISGHNELEKFMSGILQGRTEDELKRQAGILGKTVKNPAQKAHAIINASFHNANFSNRIWLYQDLLKADLAKLLQTGLIQGRNPNTLARELTKRFEVRRSDAERLMRTELARVQTEAQKQSFERNGFKEFEFIVNSNCCDICAGLNGKHFKVDKMMPGENAPPIHPYCRCSTAAYEDSNEYKAWLDYIEKGGTTAEWDKIKKAEAEYLSLHKENERITKSPKYAVDTKMLESRAYIDKFSHIADTAEERREFLQSAKTILKHRSGQNGEDLYLYNSKTKKWYRSTTGKEAGTPEYTQEILDGIAASKKGELFAFHNHPASMPPSPEDLNAALSNGYKKGYALCHNGKIFEYTAPENYINVTIYNLKVAKLEKNDYNKFDAQLETIKELSKLYGFEFKEVT